MANYKLVVKTTTSDRALLWLPSQHHPAPTDPAIYLAQLDEAENEPYISTKVLMTEGADTPG